MLGFLKKVFKSKSEQDVKYLAPLAEQVNDIYTGYAGLSDDQLREKSQELRQRIQDHIRPITDGLAENEQAIATAKAEDRIEDQETLFAQKEDLKKQRNEALEVVLNQIQHEAFALVKETCRRLAENQQLAVSATDWDRQLAQEKGYVTVQGQTALWSNTWDVGGTAMTWNMVHYDVQLMGGVVLHQGKIAEMATGEGKTLVSTLPAFLNALTGLGVHIVTVNDYLAKRDSEWNAPIFEFHGLTVDCIENTEPHSDERRQAYRADIVYGTNNEFGFDYLRDNMTTLPENLVQRDLHYAIIDEVDSVLIDEARTPLIISGPVPQGDKQEYDNLRPRVDRVVNSQRQLVHKLLNQAKADFASEDKKKRDAANLALLRCHRGLPKYKPLIKFLSEPEHKQALLKTEAFYLQDKGRKMPQVDQELYFTIDEKNNSVDLTDKGIDAMTQSGEDRDLFIVPDLAETFSAIEGDENLSPEEKRSKKEEFSRSYSEKSERLHAIQQLLKAYALFERDNDYIVQEGKVMIVDENTGRVMPGRRYSDGLHQAIEAKENVKVEAATQTFATVTLQNYFRMYHKLAGMTGTAETESGEFWEIYKLDVVVIPTNKPIIRDDRDDMVFRTQREKFNAIIEEIVALTEAGRPVLVGTSSVETSELLSRALKLRKMQHNVLNAKQHAREADVVAEAGKPGRITIATNMAGRGTDIKLAPGVREAGGLAIVGSERHDSRRIDRQLRGRAGRQGDPGSTQFFVSLEDNLMRLFAGMERISKIMNSKMMKMEEGEIIQHPWITRSISNAQRKVEENNFGIRKRLLEYDDVMNQQREVVYARRRSALFGDRIQLDLDNMLQDFCNDLAGRYLDERDADGLQLESLRLLAVDPDLSADDLAGMSEPQLAEHLYSLAREAYQQKNQRIAEALYTHMQDVRRNMPQVEVLEVQFSDGMHVVRVFVNIDKLMETQGREVINVLEKTVMLGVLDERWKEHLRDMDDLKHGVQTAAYEQKDPLLIYKFEAFQLFQVMLGRINQEVLSMLLRANVAQQTERSQAAPQHREDFSKMRARHDDVGNAAGGPAKGGQRQPQPVAAGGGQQERPLSRRERRAQERREQKKRR